MPAEYHKPSVEEQPDDDDVVFVSSHTSKTTGHSSSSRSSGKKPATTTSSPSTATNPFNISDDDDEDDDGPHASSHSRSCDPGPSTPRGQRSQPYAGPSSSSSSSSRALQPVIPGSSPVTPSRRRKEPLGVYVGTWNKAQLPLHAANAVYASRDVKGRVNRRISKENNSGQVAQGGAYNTKKTACSHEDVAYIHRFANKTKAQVDALIGSALDTQQQQQQQHAVTSPAQAQPLLMPWVDLTRDDDGDNDGDKEFLA